MFDRGARNFIFFGRSGIDNHKARDLVGDLRQRGAYVQVIRGDVSIYRDVQQAIAQIPGKVGGIVQAAMGLDVIQPLFQLFSIADKKAGIPLFHHVMR